MTRYIDASRAHFGVEPICKMLQVAPSSYYAARGRPPSARCQRDAALKEKLKQVHKAQFGVYGARKLWHQLRREGTPGGPLHRGAPDARARSERRPTRPAGSHDHR